jgi:hypothetical protein
LGDDLLELGDLCLQRLDALLSACH